jgi:hypothetical protein
METSTEGILLLATLDLAPTERCSKSFTGRLVWLVLIERRSGLIPSV